MTRTFHLCLSVRGALRNWTKRDLAQMMTDEKGRRMTAGEARDFLIEELSKGHDVIPFGNPCEGFDYKTGCPGHPQAEA